MRTKQVRGTIAYVTRFDFDAAMFSMLAVCYEYLPTKTVEASGAKTVWVKSAGKEKECLSCMLLGNSLGDKNPPFLVFKTKPSVDKETARMNAALQHGFGGRPWNDLRGQQDGVQIYGNTTGWWNSELSIQFLLFHFWRRPNMREPILLLWDDFFGHWRQDVLIMARLLNVELMKIPPRYTYVCQPADISWNKPFKDKMRAKWVEIRIRQLRQCSAGLLTKIPSPSRLDMIAWIKEAWSSISRSVIVSGFIKAGFTDAVPIDVETASPSPEVHGNTQNPDWPLLIRLMRSLNMESPAINPTRDIDTLIENVAATVGDDNSQSD